MNEIHFSEEQLDSLASVGQVLFDADPSDPRSWNYERKLVRPAIRWWRIILFSVLFISVTAVIYFLLAALKLPSFASFGIALSVGAVILIIHTKRILICMVQIYQRFAPASIRNKCRFEPSCSQYMILSLQKYGPVKGLIKGIGRLRRCNTDGGGFDYP